MSEDLQHIDEFFRDAIEHNEETISPAVWESLQARLDKEDATTYKKRFIAARRVAITLLLLLISFVIYETSLNKPGSQRLSGQNDLKNKRINEPGNTRSEKIRSSEKNDSQNNSLKRQQQFFNTDEKTSSLQENFEKKAVTDEPVSVKNNTEKGNYRVDNQVVLPEEKNILTNDAFKLQANKERHIYNYNRSRAQYLTKKNLDKWGNSAVANKSNKEDNLPVNKSDLLFARAFLTAVQPYNTKINTSLLYAETGNIIHFTGLILSDSLKQKIATLIQKKKKQDNSFRPYWTVTAIASPEWTQYSIENDLPDNVNSQQDEKAQIEQREKHESSFSLGAMTSYQFKKHWALQTGFFYSNTTIAIEPQKIYAVKESNGEIAYKYNSSSGYAFVKPSFGLPPAAGDSLNTTSSQHSLQYFSIPIIIKYKIEKRRFSISPGLGISVNFLTSTKIQTEVEDALNRETVTISKLDGTKPFYLGLIANTDIQYQFNKKWSLNVMPAFRYAITPVTKNNVVKTYPYSFGLGVGLSYRF
jgi:Outer membrane protein beta-barrel domain